MTFPALITGSDFRYALVSQPVLQPNAQGWRRGQFLHDFQWRDSKNFPYRTSRDVMDPPEVNRIGSFEDRNSHVKVALTETIQFFWAELMALHKYGRNLSALNSAERHFIDNAFDAVMGPAVALTNRSKNEVTANYVSDENVDKEPARLAPLVCGGNTVWFQSAGVNRDGTEMAWIHSWEPNDPLPNPSLATLQDPRVMWLDAIYSDRNVFPLSTLGDGVGVPYPLVTFDAYYYPMSGLVEYSHDEPKRPIYVRDGVPSYT